MARSFAGPWLLHSAHPREEFGTALQSKEKSPQTDPAQGSGREEMAEGQEGLGRPPSLVLAEEEPAVKRQRMAQEEQSWEAEGVLLSPGLSVKGEGRAALLDTNGAETQVRREGSGSAQGPDCMDDCRMDRVGMEGTPSWGRETVVLRGQEALDGGTPAREPGGRGAAALQEAPGSGRGMLGTNPPPSLTECPGLLGGAGEAGGPDSARGCGGEAEPPVT